MRLVRQVRERQADRAIVEIRRGRSARRRSGTGRARRRPPRPPVVRARSASATNPDSTSTLSGDSTPRLNIGERSPARGLERVATDGSASRARRSAAEPTIAGAGIRRMGAPVVALKRSTISFTRVGVAERDAAPLSWTISVAVVQPGSRRLASSSIVRPHDTPMAPSGRTPARWAAAAVATASRLTRSVPPSHGPSATSATTAVRSPSRVMRASSSSSRRAAGWTTSIRTIDSRTARSSSRPTLKRLRPSRSPICSWVRCMR